MTEEAARLGEVALAGGDFPGLGKETEQWDNSLILRSSGALRHKEIVPWAPKGTGPSAQRVLVSSNLLMPQVMWKQKPASCQETLRVWRVKMLAVSTVDLKLESLLFGRHYASPPSTLGFSADP